jgi:tRNA pseudouridine38-40 synthase
MPSLLRNPKQCLKQSLKSNPLTLKKTTQREPIDAETSMQSVALKRIALGVSYDGTPWQGWQTQPSGQTVQDQIERAIARFVGEPLATICAGRTDTGVHALNQVIHIDSPVTRDNISWVRGVNTFLPDSIAVQWAQPVSEAFHARFSAVSRTYHYIILNTAIAQPLWASRAGWCFRPLDAELMQQAAHHLIGQHDFSSFRSSQCQAASPVRELQALKVWRERDFVRISITANAFLHHMVRNIVGELVLVGQGKHDPDHVSAVLKQRDRTVAAPTFSAAGLYLAQVEYPESLLNIPAATEIEDLLLI